MTAPGWPAPSVAAFENLVAPLSNWRRWGPEDQLGTLNLLTDQSRLAGLASVRSGQQVSLARTIRSVASPGNPQPMLHLMKASGDAAAELGGSHASDWIGLACHGFAVTHIDALSHQFFNGFMYNGIPARAVSTRTGAGRGSVELLARGIVGRAVLADLPWALGLDWLEAGASITATQLQHALDAAQVRLQPGDLLLVRTGRDARAARHGPVDPMTAGAAGLDLDCLSWLHAHDVAVLGSDCNGEVMCPAGAPFATPIHAGALVYLGMPLLDNLLLEELGQLCLTNGRWQFLLAVAPLALHRGTGCAVNPIAVL